MLSTCTKKHLCVSCMCWILPGELELSNLGRDGRKQYSHENDAACQAAHIAMIDEVFDDPGDQIRYLGMKIPGSLADTRPDPDAILAAKHGLHIDVDSQPGTRQPAAQNRLTEILEILDDDTAG